MQWKLWCLEPIDRNRRMTEHASPQFPCEIHEVDSILWLGP